MRFSLNVVAISIPFLACVAVAQLPPYACDIGVSVSGDDALAAGQEACEFLPVRPGASQDQFTQFFDYQDRFPDSGGQDLFQYLLPNPRDQPQDLPNCTSPPSPAGKGVSIMESLRTPRLTLPLNPWI